MKKTCKHDNKKKTIFQQRMIDLRKEKDLTGQQLADKIGVSRDCIVQWENDETRQPALDKLILLADTFGVSLDYLLGRSCCRSVDNEYIHQKIGLSDKAINQLRKLVQHDTFLKQSNKDNERRKDNFSVRPVQLVERIPIINFVMGSKSFINLINDFVYYLDSDKYTKMLDGSFHELPTKEIIPADNDLIAGGVMLEIDSDTNKALAKNLLDIQLNKLVQEYKKCSDTK